MKKLLTIAIPTFNRAELLDKQLQRLHTAVQGLEDGCDILVSDNRSTDDSTAVIEKWRSRFTNLYCHRQSENIGAVRNISWCLQTAQTKFVWALSDDDPLIEDSLVGILRRLRENSDLAVMMLNYSSFNAEDGRRQSEHRFNLTEDESSRDGKTIFAKYISRGGLGALVFTSALIYRSDYARKAILAWESGQCNLLFQLYITADCANRGRFLINSDNCVRYMDGRSFFTHDRQLQFKMKLVDVPGAYAKLTEIGYSRRLGKQLFASHMKGKHFNGPRMWLQIGKFSLSHPLQALSGFGDLAGSFFRIWILPEKSAI